MTIIPNGPWFNCLPSCVTQVPCSQGMHAVRWEAGSLRLPSHPDAEAELVLAALGGDKAGCVELAEAWGRHAADLSVLAIGPRGPADQIVVSWDDVTAAAQAGQGGWVAPAPGPPRAAPMRRMARVTARQRQVQDDLERVRRRRNDILSLLALGHGFQVRLIGQVAAAHADQPDSGVRPALTAAIAGRLAPVAEQWLGIDPDQVVVSLHHGPGWGTAELAGRGQERLLRVSLPAGWLASVWACGLALAGRHLVVAVEQPGWPDARVLGLGAPGAEPVPLDVHASEGPGEPARIPRWEVRAARDGNSGPADAPH